MRSTFMSSLFYFDPEHLKKLADQHREAYSSGLPFPHIVMDRFLPENVLDEILEEFPSPKDIDWYDRKVSQQPGKLESRSETQFGAKTRHLLSQFNSGVFVAFLESLTGIQGIIPDPHYFGGGLHSIQRGGLLKVHADFTWYERLKIDRRLNLLVFLNKDWPEEYGGHFQLWDESMTECRKKVLPLFNRCVVFSTSEKSYHGHPDPLSCPEDRTRKSLALYYYTVGRDEKDTARTIETLWQDRPGNLDRRPLTMKRALRKILPPIVYDIKKSILGK
jgi:Rps23 Pro-64 3,4-dihydroxylase Tpa1-like proline 4-hydroxylase